MCLPITKTAPCVFSARIKCSGEKHNNSTDSKIPTLSCSQVYSLAATTPHS